MYEAFMIVISSSILGSLAGVLTSILISSQFYMFIEFPLEIEFPWALLIGMLLIAIATTFFAVLLPIKKVNKRQIASVLKAGAS